MQFSSKLLKIAGWIYIAVGVGLLFLFKPGPIGFLDTRESLSSIIFQTGVILVPNNVLAFAFESAKVCHGSAFFIGACELKSSMSELMSWVGASASVILLGFLLLAKAKSKTKYRDYLGLLIAIIGVLIYLSNFYWSTPFGYENYDLFIGNPWSPVALMILLALVFSDRRVYRSK